MAAAGQHKPRGDDENIPDGADACPPPISEPLPDAAEWRRREEEDDPAAAFSAFQSSNNNEPMTKITTSCGLTLYGNYTLLDFPALDDFSLSTPPDAAGLMTPSSSSVAVGDLSLAPGGQTLDPAMWSMAPPSGMSSYPSCNSNGHPPAEQSKPLTPSTVSQTSPQRFPSRSGSYATTRANSVTSIESPPPGTLLSSASSGSSGSVNKHPDQPSTSSRGGSDGDSDGSPTRKTGRANSGASTGTGTAGPISATTGGASTGTATGCGSGGWASPLHIAAKKGHDRIVRVLLRHQVDCNERDSDGLMPLMHAIIGGYEDVMVSLIEHGARIDDADAQGRTALHWAVMHRREGLLHRLLKHCQGNAAHMNAYDSAGRTPLHTAVNIGFEAGVDALLQHGADLTSKAHVP